MVASFANASPDCMPIRSMSILEFTMSTMLSGWPTGLASTRERIYEEALARETVDKNNIRDARKTRSGAEAFC